jgi:hypothetical protein
MVCNVSCRDRVGNDAPICRQISDSVAEAVTLVLTHPVREIALNSIANVIGVFIVGFPCLVSVVLNCIAPLVGNDAREGHNSRHGQP